MHAVAAHQRRTTRKRFWPWVTGAVVVALLAGAGGLAYAVSRHHTGGGSPGGTGSGAGGGSGSGATATASGGGGSGGGGGKPTALTLTKSSPASGAQSVASNTTVTLEFSAPIEQGGPMPSITPPVAGSWQRSGSTLTFAPTAPFVPFTKYTVSVPGGTSGTRDTSGRHLAATTAVSFTIAAGSTLRLQQLLAQLGYLPVSYTEPSGLAPQDLAQPQAGTLPWRWSNLPAQLTSQFTPGQANAITKGAVMAFETQNGLTVDGVAGPKVWTTLLSDVVANKASTGPYTYVLVSKTLPEHLTAWVNGAPQFTNVPVNTGVPGATTTNGTFNVFEHVRASTMIGTNVTGSHYNDPTVPWASYFNGGDALHGFVRASYGFPQSNGCVEMRVTTAGALWPYTPIGTLVTVQ